MEVLGIDPATSWSVVRHAEPLTLPKIKPEISSLEVAHSNPKDNEMSDNRQIQLNNNKIKYSKHMFVYFPCIYFITWNRVSKVFLHTIFIINKNDIPCISVSLADFISDIFWVLSLLFNYNVG